MELLIMRDGEVFARATDYSDGVHEYALATETELPEYPTEDAGRGKAWEVQYVDGVLAWVAADRPLTQEERIEELNEEVEELKHEWKPNEWVEVDDRRYYDGKWYACIQAHTTQVGWEPPIVPALWRAER